MSNSFAELGDALTERVSELKRLTLLRLEDGAKDLFTKDLSGLEASVRALEAHVATLKSCIQTELSAMPKVEALIEASRIQSEHLSAIASNLPQRLPSRAPAGAGPGLAAGSSVAGAIGPGRGLCGGGGQAAGAGPGGGAEEAARRKREAPRWYVTREEFDGLQAYMRGRLQADKLNAAVEELAGHAAANQRLVAGAKAGGGKVAPADRKRATELYHSVATKDGIKGHFWFLESDLREGVAIKPDKTGKSMLTILRHLGRIQEVRCNIDGASTTVYVLQEGSCR
ncbi:hypothetical protein HYH03_009800 [Edaphochlamys debaryana]|uniref:Spindle and kinetochore-associated protein 1 n=1 Tax=Edaphochlamys debaryana TaxID=47281 RepID=A0A836BY37_9CHLO|nr:hypothetical protein HYH03_009800 [Edaphochlamys debaryana]|eukprot:KAG2491844.1 hypothetical protein HYH03_009800 [Edaphochlamys debaryana]